MHKYNMQHIQSFKIYKTIHFYFYKIKALLNIEIF